MLIDWGCSILPVLDWIGKRAVIRHHREIPFRLLKRNTELSCDNFGSNLLVHGDNLLALKALLPYYARQVKCIYIDPPYNTGNEAWIYNDNVNSPEIKKWLGEVVGRDFEDLSRHDKWLCMMYPRLQLLKRMLRDDGFICVQIDDSESAHLKVIMDEIFGPANYLATIYVQVRYEDKTLKQDMVFHKQIEQVLIYRRSSKARPKLKKAEYTFDKFKWYVKEKGTGRETVLGGKKAVVFTPGEYEIIEGEPSPEGLKEIWATGTILDGNSSGRFFRDHLTGRAAEDGLGVLYKVYGIGDDSYDYRYFTGPKRRNATKGKYYQGVPSDVLNSTEQIKQLPIPNFYDMADSYGNCRHEGGVEFKSGKKPEKFISMLLDYFSNEGDIVLDSFAGSGTTAAVAQKMGRRWVTVEMGDHCFTHTLPRLKNVVNGKDNTGVSKQFSIPMENGFCYCELGETLFDEVGNIRKEVTFNELAHHVFFIETGQPKPYSAEKSPLLGVANDTAVYLLFNGILGDKSSNGGNVLTRSVLANLPQFNGQKVIYGEGCLIGQERLKQANIVFKQIPYQVRVD